MLFLWSLTVRQVYEAFLQQLGYKNTDSFTDCRSCLIFIFLRMVADLLYLTLPVFLNLGPVVRTN